jgi:hypothetical protein
MGVVATVTAVVAATAGTGPSSAAVTPPAPSVLLSDGSETGDLSRWMNAPVTNPANAGLTVQH